MNWEIITFIAYFVILLGVALVFYFNGTNKNSEDFFLGGRSMGPWVTALSAQASDMSAWLLLFIDHGLFSHLQNLLLTWQTERPSEPAAHEPLRLYWRL